MAVEYQNKSSASSTDGYTLTFSMTVNAGSNLALAVGIALEAVATDVESVAFNGDSLTQVNSDVPSGDTYAETQMWYMVNPDVTTGNVVVEFNDNNFTKIGAAVSMTGVHQTTPIGTAATDASTSDTSVSSTVGSVSSDDLIIDSLCCDSNVNIAEGANQTNQIESSVTGKCTLGISTQDGADGGVMSWSWTGARPCAQIAVAFKPAGGASAVNKKVVALNG